MKSLWILSKAEVDVGGKQLFEGHLSTGGVLGTVPRTGQKAAEDFKIGGNVQSIIAGELLCLCSCNKAESGIWASGRAAAVSM